MNLLSMNDLNRMYDLFKAADISSDGGISERELSKAFNLDGANEQIVAILL